MVLGKRDTQKDLMDLSLRSLFLKSEPHKFGRGRQKKSGEERGQMRVDTKKSGDVAEDTHEEM